MRRRYSTRKPNNQPFTIVDLLVEHGLYLLLLVSFWVWGARPLILFSAQLSPEYIAIRFSPYFETIDRVVKFAQGGFSPQEEQEETLVVNNDLPTAAANTQTDENQSPTLLTLSPIPDAPAQLTPIPTSSPTLPLPPPIVATSLSIIQIPTDTPSPEELAAIPTPQPTVPPEPDTVHLMFVGDIMLDRSLGTAIESGFINYPFAQVEPILRSADLTIGNFESAVGRLGEPNPRKSYTFQAPPEAGLALWGAGFDLVSLANNHALDYGPDALLDGISILEEAGVQTVGAGRNREEARAPVILESHGQKIAFLAYTNVPIEGNGFDTSSWEARPSAPGLAWGRAEDIRADVAAIRPEVNHVIVLLHSGIEYQQTPSVPQQQLSLAAIEAGATLVIGHHAHILQGTQWFQNSLVAYGLGNFAFDIDGNPNSTIMEVWLTPEEILQYQFIPVVVTLGGQPRLASPEESATILQELGN